MTRKRKSSDGRGLAVCDMTGQICDASDRVWDPRHGYVATRDADLSSGFGTWHPRDRIGLGRLDDPKPIHNARSADVIEPSKQDLGIADAAVLAKLRSAPQ